MWGICIDCKASDYGLFQKVVEYEIDHSDNKAVVILPKTNYKTDIERIRELPAPPKYSYGDKVSPCDHPDMIGIIVAINWHFSQNCCFYTIEVDGKAKSKRYFDDDLVTVI